MVLHPIAVVKVIQTMLWVIERVHIQEEVRILRRDEFYPVEGKCNDIWHNDGHNDEFNRLNSTPKPLKVP